MVGAICGATAMPMFKDPDRTRDYMRVYMARRRWLKRVEKDARIREVRTAFLARERDLRWSRERYRRGESRPSGRKHSWSCAQIEKAGDPRRPPASRVGKGTRLGRLAT
jgi:hypothetical protein